MRWKVRMNGCEVDVEAKTARGAVQKLIDQEKIVGPLRITTTAIYRPWYAFKLSAEGNLRKQASYMA